MKWDVFICHASEDKKDVALPLATRLAKTGIEVWYDEFTLSLGDSLRRKIDQGLAQSRYGVVILSPNFFAKKWPQYELDGLVAKEMNADKVILPVWHNVDRKEVEKYSLPLADRLAISTEKGLGVIIAEIIRAIQPTSPESKYEELCKLITEIDEEAERNKPTPRLEDAQIASDLVRLMVRCKQVGREIYSSVLKTEHMVKLSKWLAELQNKVDWYIDLNG